MKTMLKFVCLVSVISVANCAQFCSSKITGDKGECLSHEVCKQNKLIPDADCEADRSCCILKFLDNDCEDGLPTIFMLYSLNGTNPKLFCSGTLINSVYILTAAHCIDHDSTMPRFAKIYGSDREFKISNHYIFPGFANNDTHRLNDVGLFRLEEAIDPSVNAKTVCLGKRNLDLKKETLTISGFDRDTETVKETTTTYYNDDNCSEFMSKHEFNHNVSFHESFCYDDSYNHVPNFISGAPIMIKRENKYHQYGIATLGAMDRVKGQTTPAISPKLSIYQGWIIKTVTEPDSRMKF